LINILVVCVKERERDIEKEKCGEIEISILALCVRERESMRALKREERERGR